MRFYVNKYAQPTGEHEVHRSNCAWLPDAENRIYLGDFGYFPGCCKGSTQVLQLCRRLQALLP